MKDGCSIKALILDMDGTIIRMTVDFVTMKERFLDRLAKEPLPSNTLDPKDTMVENLARVRRYYQEHGMGGYFSLLEKDINELMAEVEMLNVRETRKIDGFDEVIRHSRNKGLKIGLLTRGSRRYAQAALHWSGIGDVFDHIICRDDFPEEEAKPNKMALQRMSSVLGVSPEESLLVGDHLIDLTLARSSGAKFVGVLTGSYDKERWNEQSCPQIIADISQLPKVIDEYCQDESN